MPADLYDHVNRHMRLRDDLFVFFVYAPIVIALLLVVALSSVVMEPWCWLRRHVFHGCASSRAAPANWHRQTRHDAHDAALIAHEQRLRHLPRTDER